MHIIQFLLLIHVGTWKGDVNIFLYTYPDQHSHIDGFLSPIIKFHCNSDLSAICDTVNYSNITYHLQSDVMMISSYVIILYAIKGKSTSSRCR